MELIASGIAVSLCIGATNFLQRARHRFQIDFLRVLSLMSVVISSGAGLTGSGLKISPLFHEGRRRVVGGAGGLVADPVVVRGCGGGTTGAGAGGWAFERRC